MKSLTLCSHTCFWVAMSVHLGTCNKTTVKPLIEGILPKGPYLPWVSMAGRAFLAGYPRNIKCCNKSQNLNVSHLVSQLSVANPLKPGVRWVINNFIVYWGATYIIGFTVSDPTEYHISGKCLFWRWQTNCINISWYSKINNFGVGFWLELEQSF